jgi:hypothetical protein
MGQGAWGRDLRHTVTPYSFFVWFLVLGALFFSGGVVTSEVVDREMVKMGRLFSGSFLGGDWSSRLHF